MSPANLNYWSISRKESPESQQKHALRIRFLRTLLCLNVIFNLGYNLKTVIRKRTSILGGACFIYEWLFHPKQCTACRKRPCSSRGKLSKKLFVIGHFKIHFSIFEIRVVSIAVNDNVHLICNSLKVDAYFSPTIVNCPF